MLQPPTAFSGQAAPSQSQWPRKHFQIHPFCFVQNSRFSLPSLGHGHLSLPSELFGVESGLPGRAQGRGRRRRKGTKRSGSVREHEESQSVAGSEGRGSSDDSWKRVSPRKSEWDIFH